MAAKCATVKAVLTQRFLFPLHPFVFAPTASYTRG